MSKHTALTLLLLLPMLLVNSLRFSVPRLILRAGDSEKMLDLTRYLDSHYQPGDVVYHVGDGSWIDMINYTSRPWIHYKMPLCGPVRGSLSQLTRSGLGVQLAPLEQLTWSRAWIITAVSPMTPECENSLINRWLKGLTPVTCINNDIIKADCLYLVVHAP